MHPENIKQLKFLIIDDCPNIRNLIKSLLKKEGIEHIQIAKDTRTALEYIENRECDVLLCDYDFGKGQNGQQFLEEITHRNLVPYGTIFIMVTAHNTRDMVMAAVESRPDDYIKKPFPNEIFLHRLKKLLYKKEILKPIYESYNDKDYLTAIKECDIAMQKYPKVAFNIGKLKGEIAISAKDFDLAEKIYHKALSYNSFDWAQYGKANTLFFKKEYSDAVEVLLELIQYNINYIEAYDLLAIIYDIQGKYGLAQNILEKASELSPQTVLRQQHLAKIALSNEDFETAKIALHNSISHGKYSHHAKITDYTELIKLYINKQDDLTKAAGLISDAKKRFYKDEKSIFHISIIDSLLQFNLGKELNAREIFFETFKKIPGEIFSFSEELQNDLLFNCEQLGEEEITLALKKDINEKTPLGSTSKLEKYKFLLKNSEGIQLYKENKIYKSIRLFEHAAQNLSEDISINMNAAQAIIMSLKNKLVGNSQEENDLKKRAKKYLDICKNLDKENEKYITLKKLYREI